LRRVDISHNVTGTAPLGGKFRLSFRGSMTSDILVGSSAAITRDNIRDALTAIDTIPTNGVTVASETLNPPFTAQSYQFTVTFTASELQGDVEDIKVVDY